MVPSFGVNLKRVKLALPPSRCHPSSGCPEIVNNWGDLKE